MTQVIIKLTESQLAALEECGAVDDWKSYYAQFESCEQQEIDDYCHDNDCTADEMRKHVDDAKLAELLEDQLSFPGPCMIVNDIVHELESILAPFYIAEKSVKAGARSLVKKLEKYLV